MKADLVLNALEHAIWVRDTELGGLICHSDAGAQYTSIRHTERLGEIGAAPSIGSVGDPIDNAVAESTIGLYKTEPINPKRPWRTVDQVEFATFKYVDWFNHHRLHAAIGNRPPVQHETLFHNHRLDPETFPNQHLELSIRPEQIKDCDDKLTKYRLLIEQQPDVTTVGAWIAEIEQERKRLHRQLGQKPESRRMTEGEIKALVAQLRDIASVLAEASPEDKRAIYDELGVTLTYQPDGKTIAVGAGGPHVLRGWCRRGESYPNSTGRDFLDLTRRLEIR